MEIYTKIEKDSQGKTFEYTYRRRIMFAKPKHALKDWRQGVEYDVLIHPVFTDKICIYKAHKHYNEESGYKTYTNLEALENDFEIKRSDEFISQKEIEVPKEPIVKVT